MNHDYSASVASLAPAPLPIWIRSRLGLQGLQDFCSGSRVRGPSCIPCKLTQFARLRTLTRRLARDPHGRDSGPESLKASRLSCSRRFAAFQVLHAAARSTRPVGGRRAGSVNSGQNLSSSFTEPWHGIGLGRSGLLSARAP